MRAAVITVSDGVASGTRLDEAGPALSALLTEAGFDDIESCVVPDEADRIAVELQRLAGRPGLVVTTGGTGFGPRDVTPEATRRVIEREAPGIAHLMISEGLTKTPRAALSRGVAGSRGSCLIINLPGSPRGAVENLEAVIGLVPHILDLLSGDTEHRGQ